MVASRVSHATDVESSQARDGARAVRRDLSDEIGRDVSGEPADRRPVCPVRVGALAPARSPRPAAAGPSPLRPAQGRPEHSREATDSGPPATCAV